MWVEETWGGAGGGFLDFCCRKKPPMRGRVDRGRVRKELRRRARPGTLRRACWRRGGRAGRWIESWAFFVLLVWAGLGREYAWSAL